MRRSARLAIGCLVLTASLGPVSAAAQLPSTSLPVFVADEHPSDVEPFDIPAIALDAKAQRIEVEVGTSFGRLTRVSP